jgi:hypothetical protein
VFVPVESHAAWLEAQGLDPLKNILGYDPGPPARPPWMLVQVTDVQGLLRRLAELDPRELVIALRGTNVYGFLKGESGSHKLLIRPEDSDGTAPFQTVAVRADSVADDESPYGALLAQWDEEQKAKVEALKAGRAAAKSPEVPEVVRVYTLEGDRSIRDLRTDVRTNQVRDVLEGDLDEFILAYLKTHEAATAWDPA